MKAVMYKGPYQVAVENVPEPKIEAANDAIVRITSIAPGRGCASHGKSGRRR